MANGRGRVYVDRRVQGALARRIVGHWFIFFGLSMLCLFALQYFTGDPTLTLMGHLGVVWQNYAFFVLLMFAIVPAFAYDSIKLSNRFAGPMVRLRKGIQAVTEGEPTVNLKFRKGDFWSDVADEFNEMVASIEAAKAEEASDKSDRVQREEVAC